MDNLVFFWGESASMASDGGWEVMRAVNGTSLISFAGLSLVLLVFFLPSFVSCPCDLGFLVEVLICIEEDIGCLLG
ncbi:family with sequence similarity 214, member [Musa troglodytarum]|uniref:Family with sequence similarity 214, member n=1 Tax=Musa troglodytarum TaxID=320322 RepID=A0A9E7GSC2_9LILI|nr:family with sequence similarity 214, member [Musa troglodytarum]